MPTTPFTTPTFSVLSAAQVGADRVRVTFSSPPQLSGFFGALTIANYIVTGISTVTVVGAQTVASDEDSIDLIMGKPIDPGAYSVEISNVTGV